MTRAILPPRIYTSSDLAGPRRREIVEAAQRGPALLRTPTGEGLVMMPQEELRRLAGIRDHAAAFLMFDSAMRRPREDRRAADFGPWAFLTCLDEDQLVEFREDVSNTLMRACAGVDVMDDVLEQWRTTAEFMGDPDALEAVQAGCGEFIEVERPELVDSEA